MPSKNLAPIIFRSSLTNVFTWFLIFKTVFPVKLIKVGDEAAKTGSEIISQKIFTELTSNLVQVLGTLFQRGPQKVVSSNR